MTIRTCLAKHILALCFISGAMFAAGSGELAGVRALAEHRLGESPPERVVEQDAVFLARPHRV